METVYINQKNLREWQERAIPTVMALGYFDGLHNGHRQVIKTAASIAEKQELPLSVMSFTPHPKIVLSNGKEPFHHLMPISEKEEKLEELGVDTFYLVKFDKEFAKLSPEEFVSQYLVDLKVVHAVAGFDFTYGFRGEGNLDRLTSDSKGTIAVSKVEKIEYKGEKISSTCIRNRILAGEMNELPHFLGHFYEVKCECKEITLVPHPHYTLPKAGCYEVMLKCGTEELNCQMLVTENGLLKLWQPIPRHMQGTSSIVWKQRISVEVNQPLKKVNIY